MFVRSVEGLGIAPGPSEPHDFFCLGDYLNK